MMKNSKYPDEVREQLLALVAGGTNVNQAAKQMGVPDSTAYYWVSRAEEDDEDYIAARHAAKKKVVEKAWGCVEKGVDAIDRQLTAAQLENYQLQTVLSKIVSNGTIDEEDRAALVDIVKNFQGVGLRDLTAATKAMQELHGTLDSQLRESDGGQTILVEFGGMEDYAGRRRSDFASPIRSRKNFCEAGRCIRPMVARAAAARAKLHAKRRFCSA